MLTATITACFERVLQHSPVGENDNFFELGGDSLLALSLLLEIKQATGRELSIDTIYDGATVRAMVAVMECDSRPRLGSCVILKPGLPVAPIFLMHGLFGNAMELVDLGRHLATSRPVYALQARGLDGQEAPNDRVEAMADNYVAEITKLQPHGPYILVGYSFGGLVAMEMARRLRARGDSIAFLGFIDTYPPPALWSFGARVGIVTRKAKIWRDRLVGMRLREAVGLLWWKISTPSGRGLRAAANLEAIDEIELPAAVRRVRQAGYDAFLTYRPVGYDGPVTFFRAATARQFPANARKAWKRYLSQLTIHTLPGDHFSMIGPHRSGTAALLSQCIEDAAPLPHGPVPATRPALLASCVS